MRLKDKKALITGGGRGIGKSIAMAYAAEGAYVYIVSRSEEELCQTKDAINANGTFRCQYFVCDIADKDQVKNLYKDVVLNVKSLDILVNNAGYLGQIAAVKDYDEEIWDEVINININGMFYVTKAFLPLMLKSAAGSIINISSTVGRRGYGMWGAYSVSKFGVEGFSEVLAQEVANHKIKVNTVNPGATRTKMRSCAYPNEDPKTLSHPDAIMDVFIYLADSKSDFISGQRFDTRTFKKNLNAKK